MKLGILGGSFDPVHHGHLLLAQDVLEKAGLDRVLFMPAAHSPLKPAAIEADGADRLRLLHLALDDDPRFGLSDLELRRGGVSYTIDTVAELETAFPGASLAWIIGADQVALLPHWRRIGELADRIEFLAVERPGSPPLETPAIPGLRLRTVRSHRLELSSSELRQRVREGKTLRFFVPPEVEAYLKSRGLYRRPHA